MPGHANHNSRGFTLVEVLVAMAILAIGLMGSLLGIFAAMDRNLNNALRNEAIKIAQQQAEAARNMPYVSIQTIPASQVIQRQVRKSMTGFTVNTATTPVTGYAPYGMTKVTTSVQWVLKNKTYTYTQETVVRQTR